MAGPIQAILGGASSLYEGLRPTDVPIRQLDADETAAAAKQAGTNRQDSPELREKFDEFVAGTFAQTMLKSLRKSTTGKVPYMDGGFAEKVFRDKLDEQLAAKIVESSENSLSADLYDGYMHRLPGTARTEAPPAAAPLETQHVPAPPASAPLTSLSVVL